MKRLAVFSSRKIKGGSVMVRVGNAVQNRDGSLNVYLDALPIDGVLHVREAVGTEKEEPPPTPPAANGDANRCPELVARPSDNRFDDRCALHAGHGGEHMVPEEVRKAREIAGVKSASGLVGP